MTVAMTVLALAGCQKETINSSSTFTTVYQTLSTACIECHKPGTAATDSNQVQLNFTTQALAYSTLMAGNVNGILTRGSCPSVKLVSVGVPGSSYLVGTINQSYASSSFGGVSGCTPYNVHYSTLNLSTTQQNAIIAWIADGAKND